MDKQTYIEKEYQEVLDEDDISSMKSKEKLIEDLKETWYVAYSEGMSYLEPKDIEKIIKLLEVPQRSEELYFSVARIETLVKCLVERTHN